MSNQADLLFFSGINISTIDMEVCATQSYFYKGPAFTTEPIQATRIITIDESSTKEKSLSSSDLSNTPEGKQTKRREPASAEPTNSKMDFKTKEGTHRVQTSKDVEPYSSVVTGIPLKYVIIASGSFAVLVFALLLLVYYLFKRR